MDQISLKCKIPDSVYVNKGVSGYGVFSKISVKKGEIIYHNSCQIVEIDKIGEIISLETDQGVFELNKNVHLSHFHENKYLLYNFDSFTNHSCDPTTICLAIDEKDLLPYNCVALKDLNPGDELTANYNAFYYEIKDPFDCKCGAKNCYGKIQGFKHLTREQQREIKDDIDPNFFQLYDLSYLKD